MGRVSAKRDKSVYQIARENLELSREKASEILDGITPERLEKIENGRVQLQPEDVLAMSRGYRAPDLCNYYCARECPIGQKYVPEVRVKNLSQIVLEMLNSLNSMQKSRDRLIEITVDGVISEDELDDFIRIQDELEQISICVETLQLWAEKMKAQGRIDIDKYNERRAKRKE